eukprot:GHUV01038433.1.p1 GENE.GHUV01038433.1~~GHUV01038433.1.p1  ORF type:complete len:155 (-),score=22.53 GHUV01038433.1:13-477(-)
MRVVRLGAYGLMIDGPIGSMWYDVLEQYVFPKEPLSTKAVLSKTALDQVVYATIMTGQQHGMWSASASFVLLCPVAVADMCLTDDSAPVCMVVLSALIVATSVPPGTHVSSSLASCALHLQVFTLLSSGYWKVTPRRLWVPCIRSSCLHWQPTT